MSHQLAPFLDHEDFERLVRDVLRRVYDDPGIERYGRKGQAQSGIDGFSPADPTVTFQCKLKDIRYQPDHRIRDELLEEMEEELLKTDPLPQTLTRFIFASTFKNDTELQQKAASLSSDTLTVEYWGWETISDHVWTYAQQLIPIYYPEIPVRTVHGFKQISRRLVQQSRISNQSQLRKLALDYYRINDRSDIVFRIVCNNLDVRNSRVMEEVYRRLEDISPSGTVWVIGEGGSGKTTILHRLAVELAERDQNVFTLNLEAQVGNDDIDTIFSMVKYCTPAGQTVLCIDNPAADEVALERLLRELPDYADNVQIILAERAHRYYALQRTGVLTYLHGEEEIEPVQVRNPRRQREDVYRRLFDLLQVDESDLEPLREIVRNERLVYVNATYSILLELRKQRKIDFDFDWDDYQKGTADVPAFSGGYKYIALLYLFGVRTPFRTFARVCGADDSQQRLFLEAFRGKAKEPIIVNEWRDELARKTTHLRTKHEVVSDVFFREHPTLDKEELLMEWCEHLDFSDAAEVQPLVSIFGNRKNYSSESSAIDVEGLIDRLLNSHLTERIVVSPKLLGALNLAKFWLLMLRERFDDAIKVLEAFIEVVPEDLHSKTELAKAYQRQGRLEEAEEVLMELFKLEPNNLQARTELAKIYQRQDKLAQAEDVLMNLLELEPDNLQARTELAKIHQRQGKHQDAETILLSLLKIDERNIRGLTEIAKVYRSQGRLEDARLALQKVLNRRPSDIPAKTELAKVYQAQRKLDEAEALLLEILRRIPRDLNARTELAKIYQRQGKLGEAEKVLLETLTIDERQLHSRTELAKIYQRQGKLEEAEKLLLESLAIDERQLHPRTELAKIYQRQGKLVEAETLLQESLAIDERQLHPRTELAKIYQRQGKLVEAETLLQESLAIDERQLHPRTELAKIYQLQGKLVEAEKLLLESLAIDERQLHPRTELAKIYQRQGKLVEAEKLLLESLAIDENQLHPRVELAKIYRRQGKLEQSVGRAEEVLELNPLADYGMSELLGTWDQLGEKEKCKERFLAFINQPGYRFSRYSQAPVFRFFQCCRRFGMKAEAKIVYERFKSQLDDRNIQLYESTLRD